MKDQNGVKLQADNFVQTDNNIYQIESAWGNTAVLLSLSAKPEILAVYGKAWSEELIARDRNDFTPLNIHLMTNAELAARAAFLEQECPDLV